MLYIFVLNMFLTDRLPYNPAAVTRAVVHLGCDQWPLIGSQLGFSMPLMNAITHDMPGARSKLFAILEAKKNAVGETRYVDEVLAACQQISLPIIGGVRDELEVRKTDAV